MNATTLKGNEVFTIHPYLDRGVLAFDDADRGLNREPFVLGADNILCMAARAAGHNPAAGFPLHFSANPIPGAAKAVKIEKPESVGGAWYLVEGYEGWLCPATLKYFDTYPEQIFFIVPKNQQGVINER